jgi:hypothetical protein
MRILLDEDTPAQLVAPLHRVLAGHRIDQVQALGWTGKKDPQVLRDAGRAGYDILLTHDKSQLTNPMLCDAIKKSGLHHVRYDQGQGTTGLALALAAIIAAMPRVMDDLISARGQRLVRIRSLDRATERHEIVDPTKQPPSPYWPR